MKFADEQELIDRSMNNNIVIHISGGVLQDVYLDGKPVNYDLIDMDIEE